MATDHLGRQGGGDIGDVEMAEELGAERGADVRGGHLRDGQSVGTFEHLCAVPGGAGRVAPPEPVADETWCGGERDGARVVFE